MTREALTNFISTVDETPQSQPIFGSTQVPNSAGGYSWEADNFAKLRRFLILGTDGGTYYIDERSLTEQNAQAVARCLKSDPVKTIQEIVDISEAGRASNNDYALFALAMAASPKFNESSVARRIALDSLPRVARIGTHLFHFVEFAQAFRGWGRGLRDAVANWYESKPAGELGYQAIKYRQRDGWSHRDVLRKAHPSGIDADHKYIYDFIVNNNVIVDADLDVPNTDDFLRHLVGFEEAQAATSEDELVRILRDYPDLPHEALPTELKNKPNVALTLLEAGMPIGAMVRNLATYTRNGVLDPGSKGAQIVLNKLADVEAIQKSRIHPLQLLTALLFYSDGNHFDGIGYSSHYMGSESSARGKGVNNPNPQITDALDAAFYLAFENVKPTGKIHHLALDTSGSMWWSDINNVPGLTPALGAAAMALVTAKSGDPYNIYSFSHRLTPLNITAGSRLPDALREVASKGGGGTDCSLPTEHARDNKLDVDMFCVYTDSETWFGGIHPSESLKKYRKESGRDARYAVIAMEANPFTIADPDDAGMLDVVGFDTATPQILSEFAQGTV